MSAGLKTFQGEILQFEDHRLLVVACLDKPDVIGQWARWLRAVSIIKA
jgi:hypothetical protein